MIYVVIGYSDIGKVPRSCCNEQGLRDYPTDCGLSFDKLELWTYEPFMHTKVSLFLIIIMIIILLMIVIILIIVIIMVTVESYISCAENIIH